MARKLWLAMFWIAALWNISGGSRMMLVAGGRLAGAAVIFTYLGAGAVPGTLIVPGVADLLLGLGFLAFAVSRLTRRRAELS